MKRQSMLAVSLCLLSIGIASPRISRPFAASSMTTSSNLYGAGIDFYTLLSIDCDDPSTRIIVLALEADTNVTLDTNWDGSPEYSWYSGANPYNTKIFSGTDSTIPPGTHLNSNKPIMVSQWHGSKNSPWLESSGITLLPFELWGNQYVAPDYSNLVELTAPIPGTTVYIDTDNNGTPEFTWTSNSTDRHEFWTNLPTANITATNRIEVATLHCVEDGYMGIPSLARVALPVELLGNEYYFMQQLLGFEGEGLEYVGASCPFLPNTVNIHMDISNSAVDTYEVTDFAGNSETIRSEKDGLNTQTPLISYVNSTKPTDAYCMTFARDYSNSVDIMTSATGIPVDSWGTDYFVIADPDDTLLGTHERLVEVIAPTPGTHIMIDVDHDGSWEYEWNSTVSEMNTTFVDLPSGSLIHGDRPFTAKQVVYRDDYRDARAYELLPVADVAIVAISTSKNGCLPMETVGQGATANITVTVENQGILLNSFNVLIKANATSVGVQTVVLNPGENKTLTFVWDTTPFAHGDYTISAEAEIVPGETDTADNTLIYGVVRVTWNGDVDGDHDVDIFDIVRMAMVYGVTKPDPSFDPNCDLDNDADIDIFDIVAAATNYGKGS